MNTHTPGPWRLGNSYSESSPTRYVEQVCGPNLQGEPVVVASVQAVQCAKAEANARLIAAAPELLQMLHYYIDLLEDYDAGVPITDPAHNHHDPWTEAKALLARIEGSE